LTSRDYDASVTEASVTEPNAPRRVLFICEHNSARSQMAEGMLRAWGGPGWEVHSAGIVATAVRPEAVHVMDELGIDIRAQESKTVDRYRGGTWDLVIPVCEEGAAACPWLPGARATEKWQFDDPSQATGDAVERVAAFRSVRDEIAAAVRDLIARS
jgi:arsenate reductase